MKNVKNTAIIKEKYEGKRDIISAISGGVHLLYSRIL
jgi:hypothetical protein